jgi:outer membrane protein OmpA-like peptidoglycan-associated protein
LDDGILVNLGNILFDINRATLRPEALATLDKLAKILRDYPQVDLQVSGHTDITGNEQYNQVLSEQRAKAVADYLAEQGIASHRVSYIGYGSTRPVSNNETTTGRAANRRVEIKILTDE